MTDENTWSADADTGGEQDIVIVHDPSGPRAVTMAVARAAGIEVEIFRLEDERDRLRAENEDLYATNARLRADNAALRGVLGNLPDWILGCGTDDDIWATAWTPKNVARHVRYRIDDIQPSPTAAERATGPESAGNGGVS